MDAHELINYLLSDQEFVKKTGLDQKLYEDEPILLTGSDLLQKPDKTQHKKHRTRGRQHRRGQRLFEDEPIHSNSDVPLPETLSILRELESDPESKFHPMSWLFVKQAKLAENFEDNYEKRGSAKLRGSMVLYERMDNAQLREYFTWRTRIREGKDSQGPSWFGELHIYELLNGIGVSDPLDGFYKIIHFWKIHRKNNPDLARSVGGWLKDYLVYHGLDKKLLDIVDKEIVLAYAERTSKKTQLLTSSAQKVFKKTANKDAGTKEETDDLSSIDSSRDALEKMSLEQALSIVLNYEDLRLSGNADLLSLEDQESREHLMVVALSSLSNYWLTKHKIFMDHPSIASIAICRAWDGYAAHCDKRRKTSLLEGLFGERRTKYCELFKRAVFYPGEGDSVHADTVYETSRACKYICKNGTWLKDSYPALDEFAGFSLDLLDFLSFVEEKLCKTLYTDTRGDSAALQYRIFPKYLSQIVDDAVKFAIQEAGLRDDRRINVDFSALQGIRDAAQTTCESLLVDEEREDMPEDYAHLVDNGGVKHKLDQDLTDSMIDPADSMADFAGSSADIAGSEADFAGSVAGLTGSTADPDSGMADLPSSLPSEQMQNDANCIECKQTVLNEVELAYLYSLIHNEEPDLRLATLKKHGTYESIVVDSINEKIYEELGDVILEEREHGIVIVEDYLDELKEMGIQ